MFKKIYVKLALVCAVFLGALYLFSDIFENVSALNFGGIVVGTMLICALPAKLLANKRKSDTGERA